MPLVSDKPRLVSTAADLQAIPEDVRFHELIDGQLTPKALPSGKHGAAQARATLSAKATGTGYLDSPVATGLYQIEELPVAATPTFSSPGGKYTC